jgi:asparagine synthase (glutamine-hydrolysing)
LGSGRAPKPKSYWSAQDAALSAAASPFKGGEDDADQAVAEALQRSVAMRLVSDVPVGAMLSGGVDSASVCASAKDAPLKTFTVGFASASHDESPAAAEMAAALGTEHTTLFVGAEELLAAVPQMAAIYDEPFADSSQLPTFLVSRALRDEVTVALSGDGGDELFGGYTRYAAGPRLWSALSSIPRGVRSAAARAVDAAGATRVASLVTTISRGDARDAAHVQTALGLLDAASEHEVFERLTRHWPNGGNVSAFQGHLENPTPDAPSGLDFARRMMLADTEAYLPDDILTKVDRASMAVSLEVRAPFLDPDLFALAWSLPTNVLIRGGAGKLPLRRRLAKIAPQGHTERRKEGFAVPLDSLLRGPLRDWAGDLLARPEACGTFYAPGKVRRAWEDHDAGRADCGHKIWPILMFEAWRETLA